MNRLVIIGNGFDMAHGFKTSYMDFINWYWDQRVYTFPVILQMYQKIAFAVWLSKIM